MPIRGCERDVRYLEITRRYHGVGDVVLTSRTSVITIAGRRSLCLGPKEQASSCSSTKQDAL